MITGGSCVGKTTLVRKLVAFLSKHHTYISFRSSHHIVCENELYQLTKHYMKNTTDLVAMNCLFLNALLIDSHRFSLRESEILIQDSYVSRVVAWCQMRGLTCIGELYEIYRERFIKFDVTILLTASLLERRRRLEKRREKQTYEDMEIINNPESVDLMDKHLEDLLCGEPNFFKLDTTKLNEDECLRRVLSHIEPLIQPKHLTIPIQPGIRQKRF